MECASSSTVMCERLVKCASGPVILCECSDVQVEMCEWFGHNVRVIGYVRVEMCVCEYSDVRVIDYVRVVRS